MTNLPPEPPAAISASLAMLPHGPGALPKIKYRFDHLKQVVAFRGILVLSMKELLHHPHHSIIFLSKFEWQKFEELQRQKSFINWN